MERGPSRPRSFYASSSMTFPGCILTLPGRSLPRKKRLFAPKARLVLACARCSTSSQLLISKKGKDMASILQVGDDNFDAEVLHAQLTVLIDLCVPWFGRWRADGPLDG